MFFRQLNTTVILNSFFSVNKPFYDNLNHLWKVNEELFGNREYLFRGFQGLYWLTNSGCSALRTIYFWPSPV